MILYLVYSNVLYIVTQKLRVHMYLHRRIHIFFQPSANVFMYERLLVDDMGNDDTLRKINQIAIQEGVEQHISAERKSQGKPEKDKEIFHKIGLYELPVHFIVVRDMNKQHIGIEQQRVHHESWYQYAAQNKSGNIFHNRHVVSKMDHGTDQKCPSENVSAVHVV